jgi:hypothetical protein
MSNYSKKDPSLEELFEWLELPKSYIYGIRNLGCKIATSTFADYNRHLAENANKPKKMVGSLKPLFTAIDRVKDERDLRSDVIPKVREHFAATRSGIFFFDQLSQLDPNLRKILKVALMYMLVHAAMLKLPGNFSRLWIIFFTNKLPCRSVGIN